MKVAVVGLSILSTVALGATPASAQSSTRVSIASDGREGLGESVAPAISADGRYVVFVSEAADLVPSDTNGDEDLFIRDRLHGVTARVNLGPGGAEVDCECDAPVISGNGRFVAFESFASNLVPGDTNTTADVFVHDRLTGVTTRVSMTTSGVQGDGRSYAASISADGRFVAFASEATNLAASDTNGASDVFIHDRATGSTTLVSATAAGQPGNGRSLSPLLSASGRFVAYTSHASSLVPNDGNGMADAFVRDLQAGTTVRISLDRNGLDADNHSVASGISSDGAIVVFRSGATDLVANDTNDATDVFVRDRPSNTTNRVHVGPGGVQADLDAFGASISSNGRYVTFESDATNLVAGDTNGRTDVFVYDRQTATTQRIGLGAGGMQLDDDSSAPMLSGDGAVAAYASLATNVVADDDNGSMDIFAVPLASATADADSDGLPNDWETQFGLDPYASALADGANGDPDSDGQTNAQERVAGTHPRGTVVTFLAEGATNALFHTRVAMANPTTSEAHVLTRFQKADGTVIRDYRTLAPMSRTTIDVETIAGLETAEFSTLIEADVQVVADRTMTWGGGNYGSHAERGILTRNATTWYFAEGATHSGFQLFYLIQNPSDQSASIEVTYLRPSAPPLVANYTVGPQTRFNVWVNSEAATVPGLAGLGATDVSAVIRSTNGVPIVAERAMYLDRPGQPFAAGHESAGVTAPATSWFLAEGATGDYFDMFILIANPSTTDATVRADYLLPSGQVVSRDYIVAANSRFNSWVDLEAPELANTAVSTTITSTNGVPLVVERAMWWPGPTSATWAEAHNSPGETTTGTKWAVAEGEVGGSSATETYTLIANTSSFEGTARVTMLFEPGTAPVTRNFTLPARSRTNVNALVDFPESAGKRFGMVVESVGSSPAQIVVERAMYSNANGVKWAAGTNVLATKLQ